MGRAIARTKRAWIGILTLVAITIALVAFLVFLWLRGRSGTNKLVLDLGGVGSSLALLTPTALNSARGKTTAVFIEASNFGVFYRTGTWTWGTQQVTQAQLAALVASIKAYGIKAYHYIVATICEQGLADAKYSDSIGQSNVLRDIPTATMIVKAGNSWTNHLLDDAANLKATYGFQGIYIDGLGDIRTVGGVPEDLVNGLKAKGLEVSGNVHPELDTQSPFYAKMDWYLAEGNPDQVIRSLRILSQQFGIPAFYFTPDPTSAIMALATKNGVGVAADTSAFQARGVISG